MSGSGVRQDGAARIGHLDAMRGWAIFLMVLIHTVRGFLLRDYAFADRIDLSDPMEAAAVAARDLLYTTEPYISALFLTVAGFTMAVVGVSGKAWSGRRLRRGLQLVLLSWAIHWVHAGVNPPYPFLSAEILYTIGLGLVFFSRFARARRFRWLGLGLISVALVGVTWYAEGHPSHALARLAQGPGAHLPNLLFFPVGLALAAIWQLRETRWRWGVLLVGLVGVVVYHSLVAPKLVVEAAARGEKVSSVEALFDEPFGRLYTERLFVVDGRFGSTYDLHLLAHGVGLEEAPPKRFLKRRTYWNKRLALMPYLVFWMGITFGLAWLPFPRRTAVIGKVSGPWSLMGRHALFLYLLHLAAIAAAVAIFGGNRAGPLATLLAMVGLLLVCLGAAAIREWLRHRQLGDR